MEIENYPNYLIYRDGRVYTKKHDKFLKPGTFYTGYYYVNLCRDGKPKPHTIHRLIAMHYIPNPQNKEQVDHKNRNRQDNRIENLRWTTRSENNHNKIMLDTNKSGHKNISYSKERKKWVFNKTINKKQYMKRFNTKTDALCYKYIFLLKYPTFRTY